MTSKKVKVSAYSRNHQIIRGHIRSSPKKVLRLLGGRRHEGSAARNNLFQVQVDNSSFNDFGVTGEDVIFSLDPRTRKWVEAGFSYDSNWWAWDICGIEPADSDPYLLPSVRIPLNEKIRGMSTEELQGLPFDRLNLGRVDDVAFLFWRTKFNSPIGSWEMGNVSSFKAMFCGAKLFNQELNSWNVNNAKNMHSMFYDAESFNRALDWWDVSNATNMHRMFYNAKRFNQSLATWNISRVEHMKDIFAGSGMSPRNLSATFVGWTETARKNGVCGGIDLGVIPCSMNELTTEGRNALQELADVHGWKASFRSR